MTEDKEYEEVEVQVPKPVYETMRHHNELDKAKSTLIDQENLLKASKKSLASKIKNLFAGKA